MSSATRQQLESWLKTIEIKGGLILDVGGSQNPLSKSRLKIFEPDEYKILDLEIPHEEKEKVDIVCDLNKDITTDIDVLNYLNYFDVAFCLEVSEYLWDTVQALNNINLFLKQGGELYLSTHFIYPCHNPIEQDYLRLTPNGIRKLLEETGFEIIEMLPRLVNNEELLRAHWGEEKMRPAKEYDKHDWAGSLIHCRKI